MITYVAYGVAVWLLLVGLYGVITSKHLVHLCLCMVVVQTATYVLLTGIGYRSGGIAPIFDTKPPTTLAVDPVVQALMLTDVVVETTVLALLLAITIQIGKHGGKCDPDAVDLMKG